MIFKDMDFKEVCKFYKSIKESLPEEDRTVIESLILQIRRAYQQVRRLVRRIQAWEDENHREFDTDDEDRESESL